MVYMMYKFTIKFPQNLKNSYLTRGPFQCKDRLSNYSNPIIKMKGSNDRLILIMGIPKRVKTAFLYQDSPQVPKSEIIESCRSACALSASGSRSLNRAHRQLPCGGAQPVQFGTLRNSAGIRGHCSKTPRLRHAGEDIGSILPPGFRGIRGVLLHWIFSNQQVSLVCFCSLIFWC